MHRFLPYRDQRLRVLEAGCGSESQIPLDSSWHVTGIDVSERQLASNPLLDERILGSLEDYRWPPNCFDVVVCWDVIEHLPNPRKALGNLFEAISPGGILVLAFPNVRSIKGLVTKYTPYKFHVYFYRFVMGFDKRRAEENIFPTFLRSEIEPGKIVEYAGANGLEVCFRMEYEGWVQTRLRQKRKLVDFIFRLIGPLGLNKSDAMLILRKRSDS